LSLPPASLFFFPQQATGLEFWLLRKENGRPEPGCSGQVAEVLLSELNQLILLL